MRNLHLGRFVVRDIALPRLAGFSWFIVVIFQPFPDFADPFLQVLDILLFPCNRLFLRLCPVVFPVGVENVVDSLFQLGCLSFELLFRAAPFLAGIRWQLAPVDGKHLPAD